MLLPARHISVLTPVFVRLRGEQGPIDVNGVIVEFAGETCVIASHTLTGVAEAAVLEGCRTAPSLSVVRVPTAQVAVDAFEGFSGALFAAPPDLLRIYYNSLDSSEQALSQAEQVAFRRQDLSASVDASPAIDGRVDRLEDAVARIEGMVASIAAGSGALAAPAVPAPQATLLAGPAGPRQAPVAAAAGPRQAAASGRRDSPETFLLTPDPPRRRRRGALVGADAARAEAERDPALSGLLGVLAAGPGEPELSGSTNSGDGDSNDDNFLAPGASPVGNAAAAGPRRERARQRDQPGRRRAGRSEDPNGLQQMLNQMLIRRLQARQDAAPAAAEGAANAAELSSEDMMLMMVMQNQQTVSLLQRQLVRQRDAESSSSDEFGLFTSDGKGDFGGHQSSKLTRGINNLRKIRRQVRGDPDAVIRRFERRVRRELGVSRGQVWSIRDFLRRIHWGRFRSSQRIAYALAESYELQRTGNTSASAAQTLQNLKAVLLSVRHNGNMSVAQALTGLPDPCQDLEAGAEPEELALVAGFLESQAQLQRHVDAAQNAQHRAASSSDALPTHDAHESEAPTPGPRPRRDPKAKAKVKALAKAEEEG